MATPNAFNRLAAQLLAHQRRLASLTNQSPPVIDLETSHLLLEIAARPELSASELVKSLGIHKSRISRKLTELQRQEIVIVIPSKLDARIGALKLTPKGITTLCKFTQQMNKITETLIAALNASERMELVKMYQALADGFETPKIVDKVSGATPFLHELRRVSRALGILGKHFLGSTLSIGEFELLSICSAYQQGDQFIRPGQIAQALSLHPSSISRLSEVLKNRRLIITQRSIKDQREIEIAISKGGLKLLQTINKRAVDALQHGLRQLDDSEIERFCELIEKYVAISSEAGRTPKSRILDSGIALTLFNSESERTRARAFFISNLVAHGRADLVPETILPKNERVFAFVDGETIFGISSWRRSDKGWRVALECNNDYLDKLMKKNARNRAIRSILKTMPFD